MSRYTDNDIPALQAQYSKKLHEHVKLFDTKRITCT